ncbi:MAG: PDDEXK nuclease domain-containing protein [Ferruginibacter sp.]
MKNEILNLRNDRDYKKWYQSIKTKINSSQIKAITKVNIELLTLYWEIGKEIVVKLKQSNWGDALIEQLSLDLSSEFSSSSGFSRSNLFYIRRWYLFYMEGTEKVPQAVVQLSESFKSTEFVPQLVVQIPWGHNREIITKCNTVEEALFYVAETIKHSWSRSVLLHQMESDLYQRKGKAVTNFKDTLSGPQGDLANELIKDPYQFDFLSLGEKYKEKDLENALVDHITRFLLELGTGFSYLGKQYRVTIDKEDFFIDLLFYHIKLRAFIVVELKTGKFVPEYAGKLNFYLNIADEMLKHPTDNPSIGLLICKTKSSVVAEYSLKGLKKPIGVTEYQLTHSLPASFKENLPSPEELENVMKSNS